MNNVDSKTLNKSLGVLQGVALSIGAVVGISILALPALTAREAGPAALLSWLVVSLLSFPIVLCIANLAVLQPTAGGILDYVSKAFGERTSSALGITFLGTIPIGMPVLSIVVARFAAHAIGMPDASALWIAFSAAATAVILNAFGVKFAGWTQVVVVAMVIGLLVVCTVAAIPLVDGRNLEPFAPNGWFAVLSATAPIFFAFVGWEIVAPMAEEFRDPEKDLKRSLFIAVCLAAVLYLAFSFVTIATGVYSEGDGINSFATLAEKSMGRIGLYIMTTLACLIGYASLHVQIAGFSRMLYSQARDGRLPANLARLSIRTRTPINSLIATLILFVAVFSAIGVFNVDIEFLIRWPAAVFIFEYMFTMAAAFFILRDRLVDRLAAIIGFIFCATVFFGCGVLMLFPVSLFSVGYLLIRERNNYQMPGTVPCITNGHVIAKDANAKLDRQT